MTDFFLTTKQTSFPGTILYFDEKSQWRNSRKIELALVKNNHNQCLR